MKIELSEIIKFAKENAGPGYKNFNDELWRLLFVKNKTIIVVEDNRIKGFGVYTELPDYLVFVTIVIKKECEQNWRGVFLMMKAMDQLPRKEICWFNKKRGRFVKCHR